MRNAFALAMAFAASAAAAPEPKHLMKDGEGLYWSAVEGVTLVYDRGGGELETRVVSKVEKVKDGRLITTEEVNADGTRSPFHKVLITPKGVFMTERTGPPYATPFEMIRLPFQPGANWEEMPKSNFGIRHAIREEKIKVPAGEFNCLHIECRSADGSATKHWYAAGVGVVKVDYGDHVMELKSITYPKPKK